MNVKYEFSDSFFDMYRLFNLNKVKLAQLYNVSISDSELTAKVQFGRRTCSLCKPNYRICNDFLRHRSTSTNPRAKTVKQNRTRIKRNYAELLIVTDSSTSQHMAKVQKLKPSDLKILALTNLNLGELYKLKFMTKNLNVFEERTYNNLTIIDNVPSTTDSTIESVITNNIIGANVPNKTEANVDNDVDILDIPSTQEINMFHPETLEDDEIIESHEVKEVESDKIQEDVKEEILEKSKVDHKSTTKGRYDIIAKTLAPYIEICNSLNLPQKGLNAVLYQRNSKILNVANIKSINVYNSLLKGFASKGNFTKVEEILQLVKRNEISLNIQSYAAIFECLGRVNIENNHLKHIRIYAKEASQAGFTFDKIMNKAVFLNDQRRWALQAMKAHTKSYVPTYAVPSNLQYRNHLLKELNNEKQLQPFLEEHHPKKNGIFTMEMLRLKMREQMDIEKVGYVTVKSIEAKPNPTAEVIKCRESLTELMKEWELSALAAFSRDLSSLVSLKQHLSLEPYLRCLPAQDFVAIIIDEAKLIAQGSETYSPTAPMLHRAMGNKVYAKYKVLRKRKTGVLDKIEKIHEKYCEDYVNSHGELDTLPTQTNSYMNPRQKWKLIESNLKIHGSSIDLDHQPWVPTVKQAIGKFLYNIVMNDIKIDVNVLHKTGERKLLPAFYTVFRHQVRSVKEEVKPHPILFRLYRQSVPETLTFPSYEIPMKCPPVPWCTLNTGGYLVTTCDIVRLPQHACLQEERMQQSSLNDMFPAFDSLNQLAAIPWKVNTRILDIILEVFNQGGSSKLDVPELPSSLLPPPNMTSDMDKTEKYEIFRQKLQFRRKKAEMYSLWCDCLYRLSLANHFRDDVFWLPHNMDFRGRVYPVPPHLNHLGSDLARSILVFAESRPLGPNGLDWLKIHVVNLTGLKKRESITNRLAYANTIMAEILDSADNPLTGKMWWVNSDEPWQTLACCMEIAKATRSPDPVTYRSNFPVHQDGSCNGLQHYAALGRDSVGAYSVNLVPTEKPQDVYSAVAALVEERRRKDAEAGHPIAKVLEGFVQRKVIKQTVMTTVYGVTRFGARLQIARQLKDIEKFPKDNVWPASSYLTSRTFESLCTMFTSTREIQDWFTDCARVIASVCEQNVEWVTPLGFPIVQPYFKYKKITTLKGYDFFTLDKYEKPNVMKQKNAFPPNFIHSLDSSHMMLTSLHCEKAGITFVSVHDCYWTHPSTIAIMNKICREQFVALHSEPILQNLSKFLSAKYSYTEEALSSDKSVESSRKVKLNKLLKKLPNTGDFDIREVLKSVYFFS